MSVYVDDMEADFGRMKMCHMMADTTDELLTMADTIGVNRKWIQHPNTPREHFDIAKSKRALAVAAGAKEITWRETGIWSIARRKAWPTVVTFDQAMAAEPSIIAEIKGSSAAAFGLLLLLLAQPCSRAVADLTSSFALQGMAKPEQAAVNRNEQVRLRVSRTARHLDRAASVGEPEGPGHSAPLLLVRRVVEEVAWLTPERSADPGQRVGVDAPGLVAGFHELVAGGHGQAGCLREGVGGHVVARGEQFAQSPGDRHVWNVAPVVRFDNSKVSAYYVRTLLT